MIIPVWCFTCGKEIWNKWDKYLRFLNEGKKNSSTNFLYIIVRNLYFNCFNIWKSNYDNDINN